MSRKGNIKINTALPVAMLGVTTLAGFTLVTKSVSADDVVDEVDITVPVSCTMSGTDMDSHTAEIANGTSNSAIGETTINALCNDANGFAIYTIGFTDDTEGKNVLSNATLGSTYDIATGTATSGTSQWAMKVTTPTSPTPAYPVSIENDFDEFHTVPDDYTMVAKRESATDIGTSATGSTIKTTYQAYIDNSQPAGTYTGQVKYVLVHPHDGTAPEKPVPFSWQESTATRPDDSKVISTMQDFDTATCALGNAGQIGWLKDSRDGTVYTIGKLADGKCWLLDNLALDLTNSTVLNGMDENNTNASNTTLDYLKGNTVRDPITDPDGKYATAGVSGWASVESYSAPLVYMENIDMTAPAGTSYDPMQAQAILGNWKYGGYYNYCAVSAGSYCYGNGKSYGTSSGNATEDICPSGWRMPTGSSSGEYQALKDIFNYNYNNYRSALRLPIAGYFGYGSMNSVSYYGGFWSSTRYYSSSVHDIMYNLYLRPDSVDSTGNVYRDQGYSVRCVLDS